MFNEMHARQTSKKIKAALHVRRMNGAHWGPYTPLGYKKDPDRKGHLLVDPETKWIVEKIFDLASHGMGAAKITRFLVEEKVPTPGWLHYSREGTYARFYEGEPEEKRYAWNVAAVKKILKDENYIGNSIHNRLSVTSFKNKTLTRNPQSEWVRVENTHEPIISRDVFDQVQGQIANRRRTQSDGTTHIFAGLLKCADCGWTMRFRRPISAGRHVFILGPGTSRREEQDMTQKFTPQSGQGGKTDKTKNVNHGFRTKKSGYGLEHFPEKDGHIFHYLNTPPRSFMKQ